MNALRLGAALLLLAMGAASAQSPQTPEWTNVDAATGRLSAIADLEALAAHFPESAQVQLRILDAAFRSNDKNRLGHAAQRLTDMGYALPAQAVEAMNGRLAAPLAGDLARRSEEALRPVGTSRLLSTIPTDYRLIEGIASDGKHRRLFASSVVSRTLLMQSGQGWGPVPSLEAGSLFGLAVDPERDLLWLASGVGEPTPAPETAFRGLIALSLDNFRIVHRLPVPQRDLSPADLAVATDGTVYASDPTNGAILRRRPEAASLDVIVPPGRLRSPQGIAVAGSHRLYVADYSYGIAIIDPITGTISRLAADRPMMLSGIDLLLLVDGDLLAIQNGTSPRRIVRIRLDRSGTRATALEVLEAANPAWGEPTLGMIRGDALVYVADAQWERFGPAGTVQGPEPLRPTAIRSLDLRRGGPRRP